MGSFLEDGAGMSFLTARFACGFPTQAFRVGEIGLVSGRRFAAGAVVTSRLSDASVEIFDQIPKRKHQISDDFLVGLGQGVEFFSSWARHKIPQARKSV